MLIFITGGTGSGKTEFAEKLCCEMRDNINSRFAEKMELELKDDGGENEIRIIYDFSQEVKSSLLEGRDVTALTEAILGEAGSGMHLIVIASELGCGLVPLDAFEREYREVNGRATCLLAQNADRVYRMISGIAQRIK